MREFKKLPAISKLSLETKVTYTLFLCINLFAYLLMVVLATQRAGWLPSEMAEYFIGNESAGRYGKTYGEIAELTHYHLFSIPIFLFLQGHIFLLTSWQKPKKIAILIFAFLSGAIYIAGPWLVMYGSKHLAFMGSIGRIGLGFCLLLFFIVPMKEMWFQTKRASS